MFRYIYIAVVSFATVFALLLLSGIFSASRPALHGVINSIPLYMCSFVLLLTVLAHVFFGSSGRILARVPLLLSLLLLAAGYWVGGLMSFSLEAVITEGQSVVIPDTQGSFRPLYVGKYAKLPPMSLMLLELNPEFSADGNSIESLSGSFVVSPHEGKEFDVVLDMDGSFSARGYSLSMEGFGYSPRYVLNSGGKVLDSSFVYMRLFPCGGEDFFRLLSPLTYYLSYHPEGVESEYFHVRVARNKDLVFDGDVFLGEAFSFENATMSIPEVRRWTKLRVEGNPGRPYLAAGLMLLLLAAFIEFRNWILRRR